jgi:ribosomal protein S6
LKKKYEAMFLFDPAAATDWDKIKAEVDRLMERAEAKVLFCGKWDERKLAYEIHGVKRAIYVLAYFEGEPAKMGALERDATLSEMIVRSLIVRADHVTEKQMKETLASGAPRPAPEGPYGGRREGEWNDSPRGRATPVPDIDEVGDLK